ncbi:acylpyruvate hydrolase [Malassezia psittaci]|uniref:Acylpyruvate hydrolase n=1 Tax=Malassezia psittaci TaxID=1821823 RepID=A0AAF0F804_9BASI|nr:acylpyruvate hydrolase [Malassezia psittaci]
MKVIVNLTLVELAVVMGKQGRDIDKKHADEYVGGYALAIDMTARNVQDKAKKQGLPWSAAKGFDTFTPISDFVPKKLIQDSSDVELWLKVNDQLKQNGNTQDMIFNVPTLLAHVSSIMTLEVGDVLLTGTPKGVGQVKPGDNITAGLQLPGSSNILAQLKLQAKQRQGGFVFDE